LSDEAEDFIDDDEEDLMESAAAGKYEDDMIDSEEDDSEEDDEEHTDEEEISAEPKAKGAGNNKKNHVSELYQPPTNEEMQGLKETSELFKSNIFKMEVGITVGFKFKLRLR
jgi:U3 small nucleolar RNA-associated protein 22